MGYERGGTVFQVVWLDSTVGELRHGQLDGSVEGLFCKWKTGSQDIRQKCAKGFTYD